MYVAKIKDIWRDMNLDSGSASYSCTNYLLLCSEVAFDNKRVISESLKNLFLIKSGHTA